MIEAKLSKHPRYTHLVTWREGEKMFKKYFNNGIKAAEFAEEKRINAKNYGSKHAAFDDDERLAVILFRDAADKMAEPPPLSSIVRDWMRLNASQIKRITIQDLVALRLKEARIKGVHDHTFRQLGGKDGNGGLLGKFAEEFGTSQAAAVTAENIETWAAQKYPSNSSYRACLILLNGLFACGVRGRYFQYNPITALQKPRPNAASAHILTVSECRALLGAIAPRSMPAIAVQLFAGLRKAEVDRLTWEDIKFDDGVIKVTQRKGAGNRRQISRFVPILPTLKAWLDLSQRKSGPILPITREGVEIGRRREGKEQAVKISLTGYVNDFRRAREVAEIYRWDANTLRHCFGSYRAASIRNLEQVKDEMGHTTTRTTNEFYRSAVTEREAGEFWSLLPSSSPALPPA